MAEHDTPPERPPLAPPPTEPSFGEPAPRRALPPAAERALAEAAARRAALRPLDLPREIDGREGPEPVRYGDWENKGIASDF